MPIKILMRILILLTASCLIFVTSLQAKTVFTKPYNAYLGNLEDDDAAVTIFSKPGMNWKNCTKITDMHTGAQICKEAVGWPDRNASITVIGGPEYRKVIDPFTDEEVNEAYVPVEFAYSRNIGTEASPHHVYKTGIGYVQMSLLTDKKYESFYSKKNKVTEKEKCPPQETKKTVLNKPKAISDITKALDKIDVVSASDAVYKSVGMCVISPPNKTPQNLPNGNLYDSLVLNKVKKQPVPKILNEKNKPMTQQDLINIDALARTLYGEMGKCFRKGLQYPMAVARVIVNRSEADSRFTEWVDPPQASGKPEMAQIMTTPRKFNNWMRSNSGRPNGPLHHSLCPPKTANEPFWRAKQASREEVDIWKNAVRIATEAVLYPEKFKARAPAMRGLYFYTSGMGRYGKNKLVHPEVNGRPLTNTDCIEVWKEPK